MPGGGTKEAARRRDATRRARAGSQPRVKSRPKELKPFMGIDGEGCGKNHKGQQHYMLLCAGNDTEHYELYTGNPLTTYECLNFICNLPPDVILTSFAFGYDATMILRDLSPERRRDVLDTVKSEWWLKGATRRSPYTYWRDFGIDYLPHNHFRVCRVERVTLHSPDGLLTWITHKPIKGTTRTIYESFGFFQRKFARALQDHDIGTQAERDLITSNKAERAQFASMTSEVRDYCALECALLSRAMTKLRSIWLDLEIKPRTPNGAGKLAAALHDKWGTIKRRDLEMLPRISGVLQHANAAFYGGRFELQRIGRVPGPVYEYDINSAYPAAMLDLPCLWHGRWEYLSGERIRRVHREEPDALYVASVRYHHKLPLCRGMCGLPHRRSGREILGSAYAGTVTWPVQGQGTYWSVELRSAEKLGAHLIFGEGWRYHKECDCCAFPDLPPLYAERQRLGSTSAGYFLKIAINALYGKLVQRIGNPRHANPIWGGLITAATRARLNDAIAQNPSAVVMIATDGLYTNAKLDLPISKNLGEWSTEMHRKGLFLVQPGIYWSDDLLTIKTRGVSRGFFAPAARRRAFERAWKQYYQADLSSDHVVPIPAVELPIRLFIGLALAQARNNPDLAGCWMDVAKTFSFDWHGKRAAKRWELGPCVKAFPLQGGKDWISATYDVDPSLTAGFDDQLELQDQPDYVLLAAHE